MALLVEGKDEENFFSALLKHLNLNDVLIRDVGGVNNFPNKFPATLISPGFRESVKAYAIVRDADTNADAAFESVRALLQKHKQPCPSQRNTFVPGPPKVGVYIMPGNRDSGMLENLCMESVSASPILPCVDAFMACISDKVQWTSVGGISVFFPNNPHKARSKCFLAGNVKDLPSVGVAALKGVWDFEHDCMRDLRTFLKELRS